MWYVESSGGLATASKMTVNYAKYNIVGSLNAGFQQVTIVQNSFLKFSQYCYGTSII